MRALLWSCGLIVVGCDGADDLVALSGAMDQTDSMVGVVIDGEVGRLYICGGPADMDRHHHWFDITREADGWSGTEGIDGLQVSLSGNPAESLTGAVSGQAGGRDAGASFDVAPGANGDGPWRSEVPLAPCGAGAVVSEGGSELQGVHFCAGVATVAQVIPIELVSSEQGRIEVQVDGQPGAEFALVPAEPGS